MANYATSALKLTDTYVNTLPYNTCSTAAGTAAKTVSAGTFALETGAMVVVKFTVTNTASNPTLNVSSTGAKAIYYNGAAITAGYLKANKIYQFIYNGTQWDLVGDVDTNTVYSHPSTHAASMITGLATVATSGKYSDLSGTPTIPTVNNATLTIQKNGTNVATFTANSASNATANITVPTGAAADKGVDTSISAASTSTNLPTSKAVAAFVEGKGYKTTDNNTTYTIASGDSNGQIKVTPSSGSAYNVSVKGLGSAAYTASTAYATAAQGTLASNALPKSGGSVSGHIYLTGAKETSSTSNTSQVVFGTSSNNHVAISSNTNALVINPNTSTTTNQIVLYLDKPSLFPSGINANLTGTASRATADGSGNNIVNTYATKTQLNSYVPTSRTINGKALSSNVTLSATDVNAAPAYTYGIEDLTGGVSELAEGKLHFVYE